MALERTLEVHALSKRYPSPRGRLPWRPPPAPHDALRAVSLIAERGEVVALIGPNGSGKSTLLRILAGILYPSEGWARVAAHDVVNDRPRIRAFIGLAQGEDRGLSPRLTVRDNLRFFGALYGLGAAETAARVGPLAERLECGHLLDRPVRTLSGGERARAALIRALLHQPQLLLLDELTRSLDPGVGARIRTWLRDEAGRTGLTVLLATHDLAEVASVAQQVVLLDQGRVAAAGDWAHVQDTARSVFARLGETA